MQKDRTTEWFVPRFGSKNFRIGVGILFLPYTGMVVSFAAWGSFAVNFSLERIVAICVLYFLALGISAHYLDSLGSKSKPWGVLPKKYIWTASLLSLGGAFVIGIYYVFLDAPLLFPIGIAESFFLFAYNLELFKGKFHNNIIFVISWGILPVLAGSVIQANTITVETLFMSGLAGVLSYILIKTSKKYKDLKKQSVDGSEIYKKEMILKIISIGVIASTVFYFIIRHA